MIKQITKPIFFGLSLLLCITISAQVTQPRPSPAATLTQKVGLTDVSVNYSRPSVIRGNNDRTGQIWGGQVPYGFNTVGFGSGNPIPWRAGANENTVISFSTPVKIEGKALYAGTYGLHMAVYEDGKVTVIFSENTTSWGSFWYDESEDVLRVDVQSKEAPFTNVLTYEFTAFTPTYAELSLLWENKQIPIKIGIDQDVIIASMKDELRGTAGFNFQGPLSAANYALQNNTHLDQALTWADQAIAANRSGQTLGVKAAILFQKGDNDAGIKVVEEAKEIATVNELNLLGYQLMGAGQHEKAAEMFQLNIERNPEVANCYDSMGECYVAMGKKKEAIKMFKKSLSLNPPANVKTNSIANLKRLGVEYSE